MKTVLLIVAFILSLTVFICSVEIATKFYEKFYRIKSVLTRLQVFTVGMFFVVLIILIPAYYVKYDFGDGYIFLRPLMFSVYYAFQSFLFEYDYALIKDLLADQCDVIKVGYSLYATMVCMIAPALTLGNIMVLFKHLRYEFIYTWIKEKDLYIFSELNVKSLTLANSILETKTDVCIVFTDVDNKKESDYSEILKEAYEMKALCLKKDIVNVDILSKKGKVELFLISDDEAQNVRQAVCITDKINTSNTKQNIKVFVFSQKDSSIHILDSIKYDKLITYAEEQGYDSENSFKLRRVNVTKQFVWKKVPQMHLWEIAEKNNKTISVLLVGMGHYGMEFFKMLLWFFQFEGYKLQLNIVDKLSGGEDGSGGIKSYIMRQCSEILRTNRSDIDGESYYDIEIISGVDMENADFDELLFYEGSDEKKKILSNRLKQTNIAMVMLGDDDRNIEVSVHLRSLFDRVHGVVAEQNTKWEDEKVEIYSLVFDKLKAGILHNKEENKKSEVEQNFLINHKNVPYHIHFIGAMSEQYSYGNIYDAELETKALKHHLAWVYNAYRNDEKMKTQSIESEKRKYEEFEYFRLSSIARQIYEYNIEKNAAIKTLRTCCLLDKGETKGDEICECANCVRRRKSEHMRWNAYTRVIGFSYSKTRDDRAKTHPNLCGWEDLSLSDRKKDD